MTLLPSVRLPSGFQWRIGTRGDRGRLLYCLQLAFSEAFPQQLSWTHLSHTVERYFDPSSAPLWWIETVRRDEGNCESQAPNGSDRLGNAVGCVWVCRGVGQVTGSPVAYVLALWVSPSYRRRGLGSAAIQVVRDWAQSNACEAIELQVFRQNLNARSFYCRNGFSEGGMWLQLQLPR